jgi:hypothetical protein
MQRLLAELDRLECDIPLVLAIKLGDAIIMIASEYGEHDLFRDAYITAIYEILLSPIDPDLKLMSMYMLRDRFVNSVTLLIQVMRHRK